MQTQFESERLLIRRLRLEDAAAVFQGWAQRPEVTRYLSWTTHQNIAETRSFLRQVDQAWKKGKGHLAYGLESKQSGQLLGGIGYGIETGCRAQVGYALRPEVWGQSYASEALKAMVQIIWQNPQVYRIYGLCHTDHQASAGVLRKVGMELEGVLRRYYILPNISPIVPCDMACYSIIRN